MTVTGSSTSRRVRVELIRLFSSDELIGQYVVVNGLVAALGEDMLKVSPYIMKCCFL